MILPKVRDPRLITIRGGGSLTEEMHCFLALWSADCAEHVLYYFENEHHEDHRPREAIEKTRLWARGIIKANESKAAAYYSNKAAQGVKGSAKIAALSAGQAAVVAHVPLHELGAAAYTIRAVMEASEKELKDYNRKKENEWQRAKLPREIRELVVEDKMNRNEICWNVFIAQ